MSQSASTPHIDEAAGLLGRRRRLLATPALDAGSLARLEGRLRARLSAAADALPDTPGQPGSADAATAHWCAVRLRDPRALEPLLEALAEPGDAADRARDALVLTPPRVEELADEPALRQEAVRRPLLEAALAAGAEVPDSLINRALAEDDPTAPALALSLAATDGRRGVDFFAPWYRADGCLPARRAALWAGLLRGDVAARAALGAALEAAATDAEADGVMRLIALAGVAEYRDSLIAHARRVPERGCALLGLFAEPGLLPVLEELMAEPASAEAAAAAWTRITGEVPPQRPRLQVVGDDTATAGGTIADAEWAAGWRQAQGSRWAQGGRWLLGRPLDPQSIARAGLDRAGADSADVLLQAQLVAGPGLRVTATQWVVARRARLLAAGLDGEPPVPADMDAIDPWERGHYA